MKETRMGTSLYGGEIHTFANFAARNFPDRKVRLRESKNRILERTKTIKENAIQRGEVLLACGTISFLSGRIVW